MHLVFDVVLLPQNSEVHSSAAHMHRFCKAFVSEGFAQGPTQ